MAMIDEQRLRARLAALDAAQRMCADRPGATVMVIEEIAERLEEWLMRPAPEDDDPHGRSFLVQTAGLCQITWRDDTGDHGCLMSIGREHEDHVCKCGASNPALTVDTGSCGFAWGTTQPETGHQHICRGVRNHDDLHRCGTCGNVFLGRSA